MQLKLDNDGHAILKDGHPIYIANGKEVVHNAADVVKERDRLKVKSMFHSSKRLNDTFDWPADMVGDLFADSFSFEDGKIVASDKHGKIYSRQRPGEVADFEEATEIMARNHSLSNVLFKKPAMPGAGSGNAPALTPAGPRVMPRRDFEAMNPQKRMAFIKSGGRIS